MTWNQVKPVIQGKILYGPATDEINEIIAMVYKIKILTALQF